MYTDIKVGFSCNNQCIHCVIEPIKRGLQSEGSNIDEDTLTIKHYIDEAVSMGSRGIVLTGGEVTLRPDFVELIEYAQNKALMVTVQTNGRMLRKKEKLKFLHRSDPVQFVVAIHGFEAEIHDRITRRPGSFQQTIEAIRNLLDCEHAKVVGKIVISNVNLGHLDGTLRLLYRLGVMDIVLAFPHAEEFPEDVFTQVVPKYLALQPKLDRMLGTVQDLFMNITLETIPYCIFPNKPEFWLCSQDIEYCLNHGKDNTFIRTPGDPTMKHWDVTRPEIKKKGPQCQKCLLDRICEGPWYEYIDHFGTEEFTPFTDTRILEYF
jgi:MoaA/NifB/PqqE/SkfB family radical SAM enzyme